MIEWIDIILDYLPSVVNGFITLILIFVAKKSGNKKVEKDLLNKLNELIDFEKKINK